LEQARKDQARARAEAEGARMKCLLHAARAATTNNLLHRAQQPLRAALDEVRMSTTMEDLYQRMLELSLTGDQEPTDKILPTRIPSTFRDEEHYISVFGSLLLEESIFAVKADILESENRGLGRIANRHVEVNCWKFTYAFKTSGKSHDMQSEGIESGLRQGQLIEMHICQPRENRLELPEDEKRSISQAPGELFHTSPGRAAVLSREELCFLFSSPLGVSSEGSRPSIATIMQSPHIKAVVSSAVAEASPPTLIVLASELLASCRKRNDANGVSWGNRPFGHWYVVPISSIATASREWAALNAIRNNHLVPLTPYILMGSQVVSADVLKAVMDSMRSKKKLFEDIWSCKSSRHFEDKEVWDHCTSIIRSLAQDVRTASAFRVDSSVLIKTKFGHFVKHDLLKSESLHAYEGVCSENSKPAEEGDIYDLLNSGREMIKAMMFTVKQAEKNRIKDEGGLQKTLPSHADMSSIVCLAETINPPLNVTVELWSALCERYNHSQLGAISSVCSDFSKQDDMHIKLLQGPPGTGKSTTIIGLISVLLLPLPQAIGHKLLGPSYDAPFILPSTVHSADNTPLSRLRNKPRLLLCTPSNIALDELLARLLKPDAVLDNLGVPRAIKIVRLGHAHFEEESTLGKVSSAELPGASIPETVRSIATFGLDYQANVKLSLTPEYKALENLRERVSERRKMGANDKLLDQLLQDCIAAERAVNWKRSQCRLEVLLESDLVAGTLSSAGRREFVTFLVESDIQFTSAIIDEACQTSEPSSLIPLRYGCRNLVLAGDPRQLPATILSPAAKAAGYGRSLFERLESLGHAKHMLTIQYRMHPLIRSFPSKRFYEEKLQDANCIEEEVIANSELPGNRYCFLGSSGLIIHSSNTSGFTSPKSLQIGVINFFDIDAHETCTSGKSFANLPEAVFCVYLALNLKTILKGRTIAIITPYAGQKKQLALQLNRVSQMCRMSDFENVEINTVDGFQGRESDVVIFSCVRTSSSGVGFLSDERRLNVAITRARGCLVVVGNSNLCKSHNAQDWRELHSFMMGNGRVVRVVPSLE
jgi:hypothetical protein